MKNPAPARPRHVLFLCTGNSARSVLAESLLNGMGQGRFRAFSAGSRPTGTVRPEAVAELVRHDLPIQGLRSKSWDEFAVPGAPSMDLVITVCDAAGGEVCPIWPGAPARAHWGIDDPAAERGEDAAIQAAFALARERLQRRIARLLALSEDEWQSPRLGAMLAAIGRQEDKRP